MSLILFDIIHPAHVHQFRRFIDHYRGQYDVIVTTRDKDVCIDLLDFYSIDYVVISQYKKNLLDKGMNYFRTVSALYRIIKRNRPILILSKASPYVIPSCALFKVPHIVFPDSEIVTLNYLMVFPYASSIITPFCFSNDLGRKHQRISGLFEEYYTSPNFFQPSKEGLDNIPRTKAKVFTLRFIDWKAHHDVGHTGLSLQNKRELIRYLIRYGEVIISSEKELPEEFHQYQIQNHPARMLDLMYYSDLFITDGQTMATESGLLGTPTIRINSMDKSMSNFIEMEKQGLVYSYNNYGSAIPHIKKIVESSAKSEWISQRKKYFKNRNDIFNETLHYINQFILPNG